LVPHATGMARTALSADDVRDHLRAAFASFESGRPRPAFLDVPLDLLAETTEHRPERFVHVSGRLQASPESIAQAIAWLATARRPLIIAGGGAQGAGDARRALAEAGASSAPTQRA